MPVRKLARLGEQVGGGERLPEQHPLLGQPLQVRRRHRVPVRLHEAAGVVRVLARFMTLLWPESVMPVLIMHPRWARPSWHPSAGVGIHAGEETRPAG